MPSQNTPDTETTYSLQVVWPRQADNPSLTELIDDQVWEAAVFDAVILTTDRSHNWIGASVGSPPGPPYHLALVDHGDAFGAARTPVSSAFYSAKQGQQIPPALLDKVGAYLASGGTETLRKLVEADRLMAMTSRLEHLLHSGTLTLPQP